MNDLDRRVGEAQGWTWNPHHEWWEFHDRNEAQKILMGDCYTPSTDLNEAVAFAEWASRQCNEAGFALEKYTDRFPKHLQQKYWARFGDTSKVHERPAEALCLATLQALEERG